MQKKIIALAIAGLASTAAFAQSNVTIYGIADVGYAFQQAAGKNVQNTIDSGLLSGSRLGFKGVEDLGNGLKAVFTLEYAIAVDNNTGVGVADAPWSGTAARQQFVGLSSAKLGTVVGGRLQTAGYDFACAYSGGFAGGAFNLNERIGASTLIQCGSGGRANNAVAYISPSFGGVTVALNHARVTENTNLVNAAAVAATPGNAGTAAVTGFGTSKDSSATLVQVTYAAGPLSVSALASKINASQTQASDDVREFGLGATYDFNVVKLNAMYVAQKANALLGTAAAPLPTTANSSKFLIGATVPVMSKGSVVVGAARSLLSADTLNNNITAYNLGYIHSLSKRTRLYAGYAYVNGQSQVAFTNTYGGFAGSTMNSQVGGNSQIFGFGMNHAF